MPRTADSSSYCVSRARWRSTRRCCCWTNRARRSIRLRRRRSQELLFHLKENCTIVIATHHLRQAARIADDTGFFLPGKLIEFGRTEIICKTPGKKETEDYITGRF